MTGLVYKLFVLEKYLGQQFISS